MNIKTYIHDIGVKALAASRKMAVLATRQKVAIVKAMADGLEARREEIIAANKADLEAAAAAGMSGPMLDRLTLTDARFRAMTEGLRTVAALPDPVGKVIKRTTRPNGMRIEKRRVPLGVVAIIFESRPNVTADAASLCIKTGNAVILRGGKEAVRSNKAIADALQAGGAEKGMPQDAVQFIEVTDHKAVNELVGLAGYVDVVIPRGGERLVRAVVEHARIPVLKHYKGVCHVYVDKKARQAQALKILDNAKCQRPSTCNAAETLLVDRAIAKTFLPKVGAWAAKKGVALRGDETVREYVPAALPATEEDWYAEYLSLTLAVRVVDGVGEAIDHINTFGSHHSDAIVTEDAAAAERFLDEVDSAAVYHNVSTRFTDGGEFGMGAEMGVSTDKFHARGPMGLEELTSYKWVVRGEGQLRG
ncbi:MAG: glutamate-5-semialdehyde dehydrogenase [Kiritimatiellae bacterium]|nr:glutamate-5-semialdehyde dehydrogenase [Kiritimatiellia bacterium]